MDKKNTITTREFIEAIRKNGLPQTAGHLFVFDTPTGLAKTNLVYPDKLVGACAIGQAYINLGINPANHVIWEEIDLDIAYLNDYEHMSFEQIADHLEYQLKDRLDDTFLTYFQDEPYIYNV